MLAWNHFWAECRDTKPIDTGHLYNKFTNPNRCHFQWENRRFVFQLPGKKPVRWLFGPSSHLHSHIPQRYRILGGTAALEKTNRSPKNDPGQTWDICIIDLDETPEISEIHLDLYNLDFCPFRSWTSKWCFYTSFFRILPKALPTTTHSKRHPLKPRLERFHHWDALEKTGAPQGLKFLEYL